MAFSAGEKLIITMLCDLLKSHKVKGEIDPDFVLEALIGRHEWGLEWKYSGIFDKKDINTPPVVYEVASILDMWEIIEISYENFTDQQKKLVKEEAEPFGNNPMFKGFDGNNETEHYSTARFLTGPLGRWDQFKGRDLNAHMPSLDTYNRMLDVFEPIQKNHNPDVLFTPKDIIQILKAKAHDYEF